MNTNRIVSKRAKMVFDYLVKLKGSYNIQGSTKPMDSGDYICRVVGGGIDQWVFASTGIPDVTDADTLTFAGKLDKTKKGKSAVTLGSLIEISVDGEAVWTARPLVKDDDEGETVNESVPPDRLPLKTAAKAPASQSTATPSQTPGRAAAGV